MPCTQRTPTHTVELSLKEARERLLCYPNSSSASYQLLGRPQLAALSILR